MGLALNVYRIYSVSAVKTVKEAMSDKAHGTYKIVRHKTVK